MSSNPIRVFIRCRPTQSFADANIKLDEEKGDISINIPKRDDQGYVDRKSVV